MARKPGPGRCVHCLQQFDKRNWDHVFPRSWYPDTTPPNLQKWQVPSCKPCNDAYGRLEEDLLVRLALCIDPDAPESASVVARGLRAMDPFQAKGQQDYLARKAKREKLAREMKHGDEIPNQGIYPNLGERWNRPREEQVAVLVPAESIRKLTEKIVRGIYFLEDHAFIKPPNLVEFYALSDEGAMPIIEMLGKYGQLYAREPGIQVRRATVAGTGQASIMSVKIFGQITMYASVMPANG